MLWNAKNPCPKSRGVLLTALRKIPKQNIFWTQDAMKRKKNCPKGLWWSHWSISAISSPYIFWRLLLLQLIGNAAILPFTNDDLGLGQLSNRNRKLKIAGCVTERYHSFARDFDILRSISKMSFLNFTHQHTPTRLFYSAHWH